MQLTVPRVRTDETGSAMMTALLSTIVMLALGLALLSIVDTQASESGKERTRDRAFNLAESVLTSEAFVLGRNWPMSAVASGTGTLTAPVERPCSDAAAAVGSAALGATATAGTGTALLQTNLNATYTDSAYTGATWQVNVCDDDGATAVWNDTTLTNGTKNWDKNANNLLWVRAQATVGTHTRALAGLVKVRSGPAFASKYGLVTGNIAEDLSTTTAAITNSALVSSLKSGLLTTNPLVAIDPLFPLPTSGVTGLRCGLLNSTGVTKTCVTGTIAAASAIPLVDALVTNGAYTQYPSTSSTSAETIGQLRAQAKTSGTYTATSAGASTAAAAPPCTITGTPTSDTVVFVETVGTGDQYCVVDVSMSKRYKALVIGSGRVVLRGDNNANAPAAYSSTATTNLFTGVIYALNLQTSDQTASTPTREVVRIEQGARVRGSVNADGKNAVVSVVPPDFNTNTLLCALVTCPSLTATTLQVLGLSDLVNTLVNGGCLVSLPLVGCTLSLPATPVSSVLAQMTSQLSTYGSAIHSDVAIVNAVTIRGASGVVPGTFRDLNRNP
jgi:Tfp pilus assembly protein PilX